MFSSKQKDFVRWMKCRSLKTVLGNFSARGLEGWDRRFSRRSKVLFHLINKRGLYFWLLKSFTFCEKIPRVACTVPYLYSYTVRMVSLHWDVVRGGVKCPQKWRKNILCKSWKVLWSFIGINAFGVFQHMNASAKFHCIFYKQVLKYHLD